MERRTFLRGALAAVLGPLFIAEPAKAAAVAAEAVGTGELSRIIIKAPVRKGDLLSLQYEQGDDGVMRMVVAPCGPGDAPSGVALGDSDKGSIETLDIGLCGVVWSREFGETKINADVELGFVDEITMVFE
jgi:hypothetical protein